MRAVLCLCVFDVSIGRQVISAKMLSLLLRGTNTRIAVRIAIAPSEK